MSTSKRIADGTLVGVVFIVCLVVAFGSFCLRKCTVAPEHSLESDLQEKIRVNELAVFRAIERWGIDGTEVSKLQKGLEEVQSRRSKAGALWGSIPEGEVIAKGRSGNYRPVGLNKEVQDLREQANRIESIVIIRQREIARDHGSSLLSTQHAPLWQEHATLIENVEALRERNAWYYRSSWGTVVKVAHGLSGILFFVSAPISVLLGLWMIGLGLSLIAEAMR